MVTRKVAAGALALGTLVVACQIVAGIERVDKVAAPVDAADVAPPPPPPAPTDPCAHTRPVDAPDANDDDTELPTIFVAVRTLDLLARDDAGASLGYDLDGVCTCDMRPNTKADGSITCAPRAGADPMATCDDPGGIDNQSTKLFELYEQPPLDINQAADVGKQIASGHETVLLSIAGYNGRANDKEVLVGLFPSAGVRAQPQSAANGQPGCTSVLNAGTGEWTPAWCGDDDWTVTTKSVVIASKPVVALRTAKGWVTDYHLVVNVQNGDTIIPFGASAVALGDAVFTGRIVPLGTDLQPRDGSRPPMPSEQRLYRVDDAVMAGRLKVHDMLVVAATFATPKSDAGGHLCTSDLFLLAQSQICQNLDIASSTGQDLVVSKPCDALSFAAKMTAFPVLEPDFYDPPADPNECLPLGDGGPPPAAKPGVTYDCP